MKILIINPNSDVKTTEMLRKKSSRLCAPDVEADCTQLTTAPELISSYEDCACTAAEMIELVKKSENDYDGFIIACYSDPNTEVIKEITDKPVIGIAEAAMRFAAVASDNFAFVSTNSKSAARKKALARKYYCSDELAEVIIPDTPARESLEKAVKDARDNGIGHVILGCANYSLYDASIESDTGSVVYDGLACAIGYIESMVRYNIYKKSVKGVSV